MAVIKQPSTNCSGSTHPVEVFFVACASSLPSHQALATLYNVCGHNQDLHCPRLKASRKMQFPVCLYVFYSFTRLLFKFSSKQIFMSAGCMTSSPLHTMPTGCPILHQYRARHQQTGPSSELPLVRRCASACCMEDSAGLQRHMHSSDQGA